MQIVILAAGKGVRLGGRFGELPKSLVPVQDDLCYIDLIVAELEHFKFSAKTVVTGYASHKMTGHFINHGYADFDFAFNPDFAKGNLYSLLAAKSKIRDGFFVFNADHYYAPQIYNTIFSSASDAITLFCDTDRNLVHDDMKISVDKKNGREILTMSKTLTRYQWGYVGVTHVPTSKLDLYWQACARAADLYGDQAHVEQVIGLLSSEGESIRIVDVSGFWWTEIDTPEDYQKACQIIAQNQPHLLSSKRA